LRGKYQSAERAVNEEVAGENRHTSQLRAPPHRDHADHSIVVSKIMIVVTRIMIVVTRIAHHGHGVRYPPDRGMAAGS